MDLNQLLQRHQLSLMRRDRASSPEERSAQSQFASDFAAEIETAREKLGAPAQVSRPPVRETSDLQFGPAACITTRVVLTPSAKLKYTVVLSHNLEERSRLSFSTMREAERHVRRISAAPAPQSTLYDREAGEV